MKKFNLKLSKTNYINNDFKITCNKDIFLVEILPVELCSDSKLPERDDIYYAEKYINCGNGLFKRIVKIVNYSNSTFSANIVLGIKTNFIPENCVIPCVMYNGNDFGAGNSPKGFEKDGKPWVFSYDRCAVPSCTLSENEECFVSCFASDYNESSLKSSCSFEKNSDGKVTHKLIYPIVERPVSYTGKNKYTEAYDTCVTFYPGTAFEAQSYIMVGVPEYKNYGYKNLLERAVNLFNNESLPSMNVKDIEDVALKHIGYAIDNEKWENKIQVFCTDYTHKIGNNILGAEWEGLTLEMIEKNPALNRLLISTVRSQMGFASQGFMQTRFLLKYALKNGEKKKFELAKSFIDGWIECQKENGLVSVNYPEKSDIAEITSLGWGASEAIKVYRLLKENDIECEKYLDFSKKLCSFFVENYSDEIQFGKQWNVNGEMVDYGGCGGSFMLRAIVELYSECKEEKYLLCAERAIKRYFEKDLDLFRCTAGAVDCDSIDKESSFPFLYSSTELYLLTGKEIYLEYAKKAATYFLSYMFCYNAIYDENSEFSKLGYKTAGGTAVSVEHQCIDPYASVIVPDLLRLYAIDGNEMWKKAAQLIWNNCTQCIAGKNGLDLHGMHRLPGMQNECFAQSRWTKYRSSPEMRGHLNDFLGIWLSDFRLYAIDGMEKLDIELE